MGRLRDVRESLDIGLLGHLWSLLLLFRLPRLRSVAIGLGASAEGLVDADDCHGVGGLLILVIHRGEDVVHAVHDVVSACEGAVGV